MNKAISRLNKMLADNGKALNLLLQQQLFLQAATLVYASIDQLCWLGCEELEQKGSDFKIWCNKYLLPLKILDCSSDDLLGARCSVLHTGTSESQHSRKGKSKKIYYTVGNSINVTSTPPDAIFISIEKLCIAFGIAAMQYISEASQLSGPEAAIFKEKSEALLNFEEI